jgi:hypothetical protein
MKFLAARTFHGREVKPMRPWAGIATRKESMPMRIAFFGAVLGLFLGFADQGSDVSATTCTDIENVSYTPYLDCTEAFSFDIFADDYLINHGDVSVVACIATTNLNNIVSPVSYVPSSPCENVLANGGTSQTMTTEANINNKNQLASFNTASHYGTNCNAHSHDFDCR